MSDTRVRILNHASEIYHDKVKKQIPLTAAEIKILNLAALITSK